MTQGHFDNTGKWVVPAYPPEARVLADISQRDLSPTTPSSIIRDMNQERSKLLDQLSAARILLARGAALTAWNLQAIAEGRPILATGADHKFLNDVHALLALGLFEGAPK
jgi:hypothetical protein